MDLIKALLIGVVLVAAVFAIPVIFATLSLILGFAVIVGIVWFVIMIVKEEPKPPD